MTDSKTVDERIAERKAAEEQLRQNLAAIDFDGPQEFHGSDMMSMFGTGKLRYAICLQCGAMVRLDDPTPSLDDAGVLIERGISLHRQFHVRN